MKRIIVLALTALMVATASWARTADDIISELRDAKHAQYVNVGKGILGLARIFGPNIPGTNSGVTSVRMLDLSDCKGNVRDKFRKLVRDLYNDGSYEEMMTSEKDDNRAVLLMRGDDQFVDEIVVVQTSESSDVIVVVRGHISAEDVAKITNDDRYYPIR